MEKQSSMTRGFSVLGLAGILNKILGVVYVPLLTMLIGNAGNGIYNAGYQIYVLIFVITNQGIPIAISKIVSGQIATGHYADARRTFGVAFLLMLALGAVSMLVMLLFSNELSALVQWPEASLTVFALAPTLLFTAVASSFRGYFQGRGNMVPTAVSQVLEQLVNTIGTVLFAYLMLGVGETVAMQAGVTDPAAAELIRVSYGAAGGTAGTSLGALVSCSYLLLTYRKKRHIFIAQVRDNPQPDALRSRKDLLRTLLRYAVPITLGAAAMYVANLIDMGFTKDRLVTAAGFSQEEARALYGILTTQYQKVIYIPLALATALSTAVIPQISRAAAVRDKDSLYGNMTKCFTLLFSIMIPAAVGLCVLARPVIMLLFPNNVDGVTLLQWGSGVLILMAFVQIETAILQGLGRARLPVWHMAVALVAKIVINYILIGIPQVNIYGAIFGSIVCYGVAALWNLHSIRRLTRLALPWRKAILPGLISSVLMAPVAFGVHAGVSALLQNVFGMSVVAGNIPATVVAVVIAVPTYFAALCLTGGITPSMAASVPRVGRRLSRLVAKVRPIPFFAALIREKEDIQE